MIEDLNIPIYRGLKVGIEDAYIIGFLFKKNYDNLKVRYFILEDKNIEVAMTYEIDPTTLSINFNNMLDSQENKIFASLDTEKGKGGDICEYKDWDGSYEDEFLNEGICIYEDLKIVFTNINEVEMDEIDFKNEVKVIGIQK